MRERVGPSAWWLAPLLVGGVLRFVTLGHQSYWNDEFVTLASLHGHLGALLHNVRVRESSPPLYWYLAWFWSRIFGFGEAGLRSLSAVCGVASIAVAATTARQVAGTRAGSAAAWFIACAPPLVWYAQEARAYSLFALLSGLSVWLMLRARRDRRPLTLGLWIAVNLAALATHYFAGFLIGAEFVVLLVRPGTLPRRVLVLAALPLVAEVIPLGLLAHAQFANSDFIRAQSLPKAAAEAAGQMLVGYGVDPVMIGCAVVSAAGLAAGAWYWARARELRLALAPAVWALALAVAVPLAIALGGEQLIDMRNLLYVVPVGGVIVGAAASRRVWPAVLAALAGFVVVAHIDLDPTLQRTNYRGAAQALGSTSQPRAILVRMSGLTYLGQYLPGLRPIGAQGERVREIALLGMTTGGGLNRQVPSLGSLRLAGAPAGFQEFQARGATTFTLRRYRAARLTQVTLAQLERAGGGAVQVLFQPAR